MPKSSKARKAAGSNNALPPGDGNENTPPQTNVPIDAVVETEHLMRAAYRDPQAAAEFVHELEVMTAQLTRAVDALEDAAVKLTANTDYFEQVPFVVKEVRNPPVVDIILDENESVLPKDFYETKKSTKSASGKPTEATDVEGREKVVRDHELNAVKRKRGSNENEDKKEGIDQSKN